MALALPGCFISMFLAQTLLLPREALAGEPPRQPVRMTTWLEREACAGGPGVLRLSPDVALGLVAFHSPYLFGAKALRSQLTCGACHAKDGLSGAALRLRLRAPVPDLRAAADRIDVAAFVTHAVVAEFDGPPVAPRTARALAALSHVLAPLSSEPAQVCQVDADSLVAVGLQLAIARVGAADGDADDLDFLIDSLRFFLGEMARGLPPDGPLPRLDEANRTLHDLMPVARDVSARVRLATLQGLAKRWEAVSSGPQVVLALGAVPGHE